MTNKLVDINKLNWGTCPASGRLVKAWLDEAPAVEVRQVVHAKWEKHKCTNCGKTEPGYYDYVEDCIVYTPSAYCPSCGAMMWR